MPQPLWEIGGQGDLIHFAPANGFAPATYMPLLRRLTEHYRVVSLPPRALWGDPMPPTTLRDWRVMGDDLLDGLRQYDLSGVIAIGHSFGGVASLLAARAEPQRFRGLCLLDPTILPPPAMEYIRQIQEQNTVDQLPLVQGAQRRRRHFDSVDEAYTYFRTKRLFSDWSDEAVRAYAAAGTQPAANGTGRELVWSPEWEAYYFSTLYTGTWEVLPELRGKLPLLILRGASTDTFIPEAAEQVRALLPEATYIDIPGGHLFPQSAPDETYRAIIQWIETFDKPQEISPDAH